MRIFIFFSVFCSIVLSASAQNVIELKNSQTGKTRVLKAGSKLYFKSANDSSYIKGKVVQIKDTSIVFYCPDFDEDLPLYDIKLEDIREIKKPTTLHSVSRSVASILLPVGGYLFINGILALSRDNQFQGKSTYNEDLTKSLTVMGGAFILGGTIPFLIKPKVYDLKKDWSLSVKKQNK